MEGRDFGSKPGSGGAASDQASRLLLPPSLAALSPLPLAHSRPRQVAGVDRRERLRKLALETIDLAKDPYFMRNHLGQLECRLCLTVHPNEGNYLAHTQGRRHQENLAKRAARDAVDAPAPPPKLRAAPRKGAKIGRPGYRVTKQFDPDTRQRSLLFQIDYAEVVDARTSPRYRFMSSYEQKVEAWDKRYQYLLFAAEPYEVIAFKVPNAEVDKSPERLFTHWERDKKLFTLCISFKTASRAPTAMPPPPPPPPLPIGGMPMPPPPPPPLPAGLPPGMPPPPPLPMGLPPGMPPPPPPLPLGLPPGMPPPPPPPPPM